MTAPLAVNTCRAYPARRADRGVRLDICTALVHWAIVLACRVEVPDVMARSKEKT